MCGGKRSDRTNRRQVRRGLSGNVKQLDLLRREAKQWEMKLQKQKALESSSGSLEIILRTTGNQPVV